MARIIYVTKPTDAAKQAEHEAKTIIGDSLNGADKDIVLAIGGDGTMLRAVREFSGDDVLFAGISAGSLGLLQTVEAKNIQQLADALKTGGYQTIRAPLLGAAYCRPSGENAKDDEQLQIIGYAFNDISVERAGAKAAKFHLKIDDSNGSFIGDGVIFATPLGSTAYSLAAGGPIVDAEVEDVFVITPNNPHMSSINSSLQRPHVISKSRKVRIEVNPHDKGEHAAKLVIDGETAVNVIAEPINIYVSSHSVRLIQLAGNGIHKRIEAKRLGRL